MTPISKQLKPSKQLKHNLRRRAHELKTVVIVGNQGLTEAVHLEIERALIAHELIKIKINAEDKTSRGNMIDEIGKTHDAQVIQTVGHIAVFYRLNPKSFS